MTGTPTLLFDMDGTLVDSTAVVERTWTAFAHRHDLRADDVLAFAHGRPTRATVLRFHPDPADAEAEAARIVAEEESDFDGVVAIPGAVELLRQLPTDRWGIVTSASRTLALGRLASAGIDAPPVLITSEDVSVGKPDPQGYLDAARRLGADIAGCVVFEDSEAGIMAGVSSGATTVVVGTLARFDATLRRIPDLTTVWPPRSADAWAIPGNGA